VVELYLHCPIRLHGKALIMHRDNFTLLLPLLDTSSIKYDQKGGRDSRHPKLRCCEVPGLFVNE
jgi:hypothetical protein